MSTKIRITRGWVEWEMSTNHFLAATCSQGGRQVSTRITIIRSPHTLRNKKGRIESGTCSKKCRTSARPIRPRSATQPRSQRTWTHTFLLKCLGHCQGRWRNQLSEVKFTSTNGVPSNLLEETLRQDRKGKRQNKIRGQV